MNVSPPSRMSSPPRPHTLALALSAGIALWFGIGLQPPWWWTFLAPVPLLWLSFSRETSRDARLGAAIATVIAATHYVPYFRLVMPMPAVVAATLGTALTWYAPTILARIIVRRLHSGWSVLAWPLAWVALDLLMANLLPDGNWGSPAYALATMPVLLQLASLAGTSGLLFVLCLPASALALLLWRGQYVRRPAWLAGAVVAVLAASLGFGTWRLHVPQTGTPMKIGLASIDDAIGPHATTGYRTAIRDRYDTLIATLAAQGAQLVLLPEKIAVLPTDELTRWQTHFAEQARQHRVWLLLGIAEDGQHPHNLAWLFDPQGRLAENYEKQFLAPPERAQHYARGRDHALADIGGARWGMAICKDMHFASLGHAYGIREAAVMLVPAWDFGYADATLAARMTAMRGVENGYSVVRAAREGLLTVTDAEGRTLLEERSAAMPGHAAIATLPLAPRRPTLYGHISDAFGWVCMATLLAMLAAALRKRRTPAPGIAIG